MSGTWSTWIDSERNLVRWRLCGFFEPKDVETFHQDCLTAVRRLGPAQGQHLALSDITEMVIQSQEAVTRFGAVLNDPRVMPRRHAVVVPATLVRSQFLRVAPSATIRLFSDAEAALLWLLAEA